MGSQFVQCPCIHSALKIYDFVDRTPEFHPAPAIKFRSLATIDTYTIVRPEESQNKPALFLSNAKWLAAVSNISFWQAITQPVIGYPENFDVANLQTDFLM